MSSISIDEEIFNGYADLHTHTSISDGFLTPQDFIKHAYEYHKLTAEHIITNFFGDIYKLAGSQKREFYEAKAEKMLGYAHNLTVVGLTDHNTVLNLEMLVKAFENYHKLHHPKKRIALVGGVEASLMCHFPSLGQHGVHVLIYFIPEQGKIDLTSLTLEEREHFFNILLRDYVPILNEINEGINRRFGKLMIDRANTHFRQPEKTIRYGEAEEQAKKRILSDLHTLSLLQGNTINTSNHPIAVTHTDIAELMEKKEIVKDKKEALQKYLGRKCACYVDYEEDWRKLYIEEFCKRMREISSLSPVKCLIGVAHPSTYARHIIDKIGNTELIELPLGEEQSQSYKKIIQNALDEVSGVIIFLKNEGLIDFIEALTTRYSKELNIAQTIEDQIKAYEYNEREKKFIEQCIVYFGALAAIYPLLLSCGSDFHGGSADTRKLGFGNSEKIFSASIVRDLFREEYQKSFFHSIQRSD